MKVSKDEKSCYGDQMHFGHEPIFQWLAQYAYQPGMVYGILFAMMIASAVGVPIPEEVSILSIGVLSYMGKHPELFPPPYPGAPVIKGWEAAIFVAMAVFLSDNIIFWLGRTFGRKILRNRRFKGFFEGPTMERINRFVKKYGIYATFIFRFTPGLRFPAHIFLGMSKFSFMSFMAVDLFAVMISVPTQVLIVDHFGEEIISTLYRFKIYVAVVLGALAILWGAKKIWQKIREYRRAQKIHAKAQRRAAEHHPRK
jgi:membrane protein DedA with SNARE-associated domain